MLTQNKRSVLWIGLLGGTALLLAACSGPIQEDLTAPAQPTGETSSSLSAEQDQPPIAVEEAAESEGVVSQSPDCTNPFENETIRFSTNFWESAGTNFCLHSVPYGEFSSGGPPPDGIPPIDAPVFESVVAADEWLGDDWPIVFFENNDDARAYPIAILVWHEIVNDEVGGDPIAITFCPLCNSTIAFNRELPDGTVLDFGTSGNLRNSDLVMYDRQTFSWWQQFTGEGVVGVNTGTMLEFLPSQIISWADFKEYNPEGQVLSRDTGTNRNYGNNPYSGYDNINSSPFLFAGETDGRLPAMERVVAINVDGVDMAYPFMPLSEVGVVNDVVAGEAVVVLWKAGTESAFNSGGQLSQPNDVGSSSVYLRSLDGIELFFEANDDGTFEDSETGSTWNIFGEAIAGELAGSQLDQLVSAEHFWFAWGAFKPDTMIWEVAS